MNSEPNFHYEIEFPDFEPSDSIREDVKKYLKKLEQLFERIISCRVAIRAPHVSKKKHIYHINLHLEIPGEDIIIDHEPEKDITHTKMHLAIRDAFNSLHRKLRKRTEHLRTSRRTNHRGHPIGIIKSFDPNNEYGFITTDTGREIYFHQNSLINGKVNQLVPGARVKYVETDGIKGSQVSTLYLASKK